MSSDPRTAILNAAGEVFARFGFKKASMEDIARRAGVGKGSLYLHFESKEELFEVCVRQATGQGLAELDAAVRRASTPEAKLRAYLQGKLQQGSRTVDGQRIQLETLFELGTQAVRFMPEIQEKEAALVARILIEGNAQGVFAVPDPQLVATGLVETVTSITIKLMTQDSKVPLGTAMEAYFDIFIRGLAPPAVTRPPKS